MNNEQHKEIIDDIRKLFDTLAADNEEYSQGDYATDYHKGKAQAYRLCAERMQRHLELMEELA